ncbi:MAG TPA: hypoxanthine-guanine phosphoribosyltransferase [Burkholderiales bacterium]|nr:hypoxanthine-guanine phosphoribosyltransferase [Burkholderiales bacterium]
MLLNVEQAQRMLEQADLLCPREQVDAAIEQLAQKLCKDFRGRQPLLLCVMNGAVYFCGKLLPLLDFPLHLDYVHASRYGDHLNGQQIQWKVAPPPYVKDRAVLVLDDILDEGLTLAAIKDQVLALGARSCEVAVLADKQTGRPKPVRADYVGLQVPDRFVFGCGLDAYGSWRNLPAIYALKEHKV